MHPMKILHSTLRKENNDLKLTIKDLLAEQIHLMARIAQLELDIEDRDRAISRSKAQITRLKKQVPAKATKKP